MHHSIWVGYDPRETEAFAVCRRTLRHFAPGVPIHAVVLDELRDAGIYRRPTSKRGAQLWDDISDAPMSTQFAISRFLVPRLAGTGWALFMDCDIIARQPLSELFASLDARYAVMCVQHPNYTPPDAVKMDGQMQTLYARKNWTSVMAFNCEHIANRRLTIDMINELPGRDMHRFCWLKDKEIGALDPKWNFLVGVSDPKIDPGLCHFTSGGPWFEDYRDVPYAGEWLAERQEWLDEERFVHGRPSTWDKPAYVNGVA
jgi:hypothetical protein